MSVECIDSSDSVADGFGFEETAYGPLNQPLWNGRDVQLSIERHQRLALISQFYLKALQMLEEAEKSEMRSSEYHLLDLQDEIDDTAEYAYPYALYHPIHGEFALLDPRNYDADLLQCKNWGFRKLERIGKELKKLGEKTWDTTKKAAKKGKKALKKTGKACEHVGREAVHAVKKVADTTIDFVTDHKKEFLIGAGVVAVAVGAYFLLGAAAAGSTAGAGAAVGGAKGLGRRREDEEGSDLDVSGSSPTPNDSSQPFSSLFENEQAKSISSEFENHSMSPMRTSANEFSGDPATFTKGSDLNPFPQYAMEFQKPFSHDPLAQHSLGGPSERFIILESLLKPLTSMNAASPQQHDYIEGMRWATSMLTASLDSKEIGASDNWMDPIMHALPEQDRYYVENLLKGTLSPGVTPEVQAFLDGHKEGDSMNALDSIMEFFGKNGGMFNSATSSSEPSITSLPRELRNFHNISSPGSQSSTGPSESCHIGTPGWTRQGMSAGFVNGMNTSVDEAYSHLENLGKFSGGMAMKGVYNHSNGFLADILEIFTLSYNGISPITADSLLEDWIKFHEENKNNPNAKYLQFTHSMGTILAKNALMKAPKEIRDRVIICALGPAIIIPADLCYKSFHYASKLDRVHLGQNISTLLLGAGNLASLEGEDRADILNRLQEDKERLILLEPHPDRDPNDGWDHSFQSPTFDDVKKDILQDYINRNGQYE